MRGRCRGRLGRCRGLVRGREDDVLDDVEDDSRAIWAIRDDLKMFWVNPGHLGDPWDDLKTT
eukprot:5955259-Lingulodinium_polyedra.AAC.1